MADPHMQSLSYVAEVPETNSGGNRRTAMQSLTSLRRSNRLRALVFVISVAIGALAAPALANEEAEDRYHDAYALEVVDGKVAEAARLYLALVSDAKTPTSVRDESRFRFAVCSVLLGRSDEARRLLGELAKDGTVDEALRARAREYESAISEVGIGTEVDRKLQSLVFDLGRTQTHEFSPPVYRDFEILGDVARPFLLKLLSHSDRNLRFHAFRLLCRMNEPDLMRRWTAEIGVSVRHPRWEIRSYLSRNPDQRAVLEERILALDDERLEKLWPDANEPLELSEEFTRAVAQRLPASHCLLRIAKSLPPDQRRAFLREWSRSDDTLFAAEAAKELLQMSGQGFHEEAPAPGRTLELTKATIGVHGTYNSKVTSWCRGLYQYAARASADELLACLEFVVEASRGWPNSGKRSAVERGLGWLFAEVLDERRDDGIDRVRHVRVLSAFLEVEAETARTRAQKPADYEERFQPESATLDWMRKAMTGLPQDDLGPAIDSLMSGPAADHPIRYLPAMPTSRPEVAERLIAEIEGFSPQLQIRAIQYLVNSDHRSYFGDANAWRPEIATCEVVTRLVPKLVQITPANVESLSDYYTRSLIVLEPDVARQRLVALAEILGRTQPTQVMSLQRNAVQNLLNASGAWADRQVVIPALDALYEVAPNALYRSTLVDTVVLQIGNEARSGTERDDAFQTMCAFVRAHYADVKQWHVLQENRALFPIREWAHLAPNGLWSPKRLGMDLGSPELDALVREVASDPSQVNASVVSVVTKLASPATRDEIIDRLLREAPLELLDPVVGALRSRTAVVGSTDAIEAAMKRLAADPKSSWSVLSSVTRIAINRRPTELAFPAVRNLLARSNRDAVIAGIGFANSLGRQALVPDLVANLDSMDRDVRTHSRTAIDSIMELERLRKETREKFGGGDPPDDG